ncbi:MAG: S49 family peptidase [Paracoccaceae bacterium]
MRIPFLSRAPVVPVIRLTGIIAGGSRFGGGGLNDQGMAPLIERAFRKGKAAAVALAINSPGGSPAQSSLIAARIRRLADEHKLPVHAFVEDVAASGGYWLATAADAIWVDPTSVLGSIGVISSGFGFQDLIARAGVERRVHTAGASKSMLDPFRPEKPDDVERLNAILEGLHETFKAQVTARRGARLAKDRDLFTGDIWVGQAAVGVGLADGVAHLVPKMRELYGDRVRFQPLAPRRPLLRRFGMSLMADAAETVEERALLARYGL